MSGLLARLFGSSSPSVVSAPTVRGEWIENKTHSSAWVTEWNYVDTASSRVLACVTKSDTDAGWKVWQNGSGRGEYLDENKARAVAENLTK